MNSPLRSLTQFLQEHARRFLSLFRRKRLEREMEEEIRFHLEMQVEQNLEAGMATEEARFAARRQFGNQTWWKEASREMWSLTSIETLLQDLRYGARVLRKNPGFTLIAVLTLALGVGANTAIFSVVNGVLLKPLPYEQPGRLVNLWEAAPWGNSTVSPGAFIDWKESDASLEALSVVLDAEMNLSGEGEAERLSGLTVSASYLQILRLQPMFGRGFLLEEDQPGQ
jgi:putative ABC transport system permease protein